MSRRRGFLLGKFMPPHRGHLFLAETAQAMVDEMTVLVCSTPHEPIEGGLRHAWMAESLPGCRVIHMHRDIPQEPGEHPEFWDIWQAAVREHHPEPISHVFGSEAYVHRLAEVCRAQPVIIDPQREICPVSGRAVRADPWGQWAHVPGAVRPFYQRRICLVGPESSGKTVLSRALADRFGATVMPEYGRIYDAAYRNGSGWGPGDFIAISETHQAMRATLAKQARPLIVEDTDPLQTRVWEEYLTGDAHIDPGRLADHYLVLSAETAWQDDGTRYGGGAQVRDWFVERLCDELTARGARFDLIGGADWGVRQAAAVARVAQLVEDWRVVKDWRGNSLAIGRGADSQEGPLY